MSAPPKTVLTATPEEEAAIRNAVRTADPEALGPKRIIAARRSSFSTHTLHVEPCDRYSIPSGPKPIVLVK